MFLNPVFQLLALGTVAGNDEAPFRIKAFPCLQNGHQAFLRCKPPYEKDVPPFRRRYIRQKVRFYKQGEYGSFFLRNACGF